MIPDLGKSKRLRRSSHISEVFLTPQENTNSFTTTQRNTTIRGGEGADNFYVATYGNPVEDTPPYIANK